MWSRRSLQAAEFTNTKPAGVIPSQYFTVCICLTSSEHSSAAPLGAATTEKDVKACISLMHHNNEHSNCPTGLQLAGELTNMRASNPKTLLKKLDRKLNEHSLNRLRLITKLLFVLIRLLLSRGGKRFFT